MSIPHPIPYQGSKRRLATHIASYFPAQFDRFIEPFAGSAALSLYVAHHNYAEKIIINDINQPLIVLWSHILNHPQKLGAQYTRLWSMQTNRERRFYDAVRTRFNLTHRPDYFLYLLARCVKASVRYNANGEFNQSPDNRRRGRKPSAMQRDITQTSALLAGRTSLYSRDYRDVLAMATPDDLIYLDPPYEGTSQGRDPRYLQGLDKTAFIDALHDLNQRGIRYIVSYDGKTGHKSFGEGLPNSLALKHITISAGRSSQATLLGRKAHTTESLYLSPVLADQIDTSHEHPQQLALF